jgi:FtsP/CotA-like multicopper oxidase with cupredoxin domain
MALTVNRRDFLRLTGVAGATALMAGVNQSTTLGQEPPPISDEARQAFAEFCGLPDPLVPGPGELVIRGVAYPYEDPETGEWFYHAPIRQQVYLDIPRTPLTKPVNLLENLPERIESKDGVLQWDLDARFAEVVVNGQTLNIRTYNGGFPGPILVAKPGDVLRIHHTNSLPPEPNEPHTNINHPHGFNTINLHTHGLNGSPVGNEDNPLLNIPPGGVFDYEIFVDEEHPSGTYWYHPHKHGATSNHVGSGMAGFFLIVDPEKDIRAVPEIGAAKEVPIMLQELYIQDNEDGTGYVPDWPTPIEQFYYGPEVRIEMTVNGFACNELQANGDVVIPEIHMQPGEVQHWRVAHSGIFSNFILGIEEHDMHIVAYDGLTLEQVETASEFVFASGQRRDILVKASMTPGTYAVKRKRYKQAQQLNTWPEQTLFNIVVSGAPKAMALPTTLNPEVEKLPYITEDEIVAERKVTMQFVDNTSANLFIHLISKRIFNPGHIDFCMVKDTAEIWHVCNDLSSDHPFHLHVNWFEVHRMVDRYGTVTDYNPPIWMDTVNVPRGGYATIRIRLHKFQGLSVLHCHMLPHEDEGMMSLVEIVDGAPKSAIITEEGGLLVSPEYDNRVVVKFQEKCVTGEAEVTYQFNSSPNEPTTNPAPALDHGMADYGRFFSLTATQDGAPLTELNRAALITVSYSPGQALNPAGQQLPLSHLQLYHYDEAAGAWSAEGISVISQTHQAVTCTTRKLGRFALTGHTETCYDLTGDGIVDTADIAFVAQFINTPYEYFQGLYDLTGDGQVNGDDVQLVSMKANDFYEGPYCRH